MKWERVDNASMRTLKKPGGQHPQKQGWNLNSRKGVLSILRRGRKPKRVLMHKDLQIG